MNPAVFSHRMIVPTSAIDLNGHVNNVVFVQWMQDIAVRHFRSAGGEDAMREAGGSWVARSHKVEYLIPAYLKDEIVIRTWIVNFSRVRSMRRYEFARAADAKVLVRGETDWVYVDAKTGRPASIPDTIKEKFALLPD